MACTSSSSSSSRLLLAFSSFRTHLPVVSVLALTLLCASSSFLAARSGSLLPFLNSVVSVSLPRLWRALLPWITPPFLFALLNGIIVLLTVTSTGVVHRGAGPEPPRAMHLTLNAAHLPQSKASAKRHVPRASSEQQVDALEEDDAVLKDAAPAVADDGEDDHAHCLTDSSPQWQACEETLDEVEDLHPMPRSSPRKPRAIARSQSAGSAAMSGEAGALPPKKRRGRRASMEEVSFVCDGDGAARSAMQQKSSSALPPPPQMVMHHQEDFMISDEALKKRIDDFISRMNAHMRSEAP